jgi:hypothetical protein
MSVYMKDLLERVVWTFLTAAGGVAVAAGPAHWMEVGVWQGAAIAGLAAAGSLVKGILARGVGNRDSASTVSGV